MTEQIDGVPAGWQVVRIGTPRFGEYYLEYYRQPEATAYGIRAIKEDRNLTGTADYPIVIVARIAHWQKLWPIQWQDKPVEGRVRSHIDEPWTYALIVQYRPGVMKWRTSESRWYKFAEVRSMDIPK